MSEKFSAMLTSRRVLANVACVVVTLYGAKLGLDTAQVAKICGLIQAWAIGVSIRPSGTYVEGMVVTLQDKLKELMISRRFLVAAGGIATVVMGSGLGLSSIVTAITTATLSGWILSDSIKPTGNKV